MKKYDVNLEIEYEVEDLKKYKKVHINKYTKSVEEYLKFHPDAKKIPVQRKIMRLVNKHLVLLEHPFPSNDIFYNNVNLSIIKQKFTQNSEHSFTLFVFQDYIYCNRCEFLIYYNVGDSIFIKNGKFSDALKGQFTETFYKSRRIVKIIDNQLLKVEKPFPKDYNGLIIRNYYFVFDSISKKFKWINGKGIVKVKNRLIIGQNTKFREQFNQGDMIVLFNINRVLKDFHQTSTNTKLYEYEECIVDKVLSNNLLLTKKKCPKVYLQKGDYFIGKPFESNDGVFTKNLTYRRTISLIDFENFESLNLDYNNKNFAHGDYLFHPGLIIHRENETVFRMKIEKLNSISAAYVRILFGTDMNYFKNKKLNQDKDLELIIYSQTGALIKKVKDEESKNIQFYDTQIRTLFNEFIHVDIIFKNNAIYFSTSDDDKNTSIKIKFDLDSGDVIKYLYFDIKESNNSKIKDLEKLNIVENQFLFDIFLFEKKMTLDENAYWVEEFKDGDYCDVIDAYRKTIIEYKCDITGNNDINISIVSENSTCEYKYTVISRHFCNPLHLMKYQIDAAVTKTKCVALNNIYNFDSEDYFRDIRY